MIFASTFAAVLHFSTQPKIGRFQASDVFVFLLLRHSTVDPSIENCSLLVVKSRLMFFFATVFLFTFYQVNDVECVLGFDGRC